MKKKILETYNLIEEQYKEFKKKGIVQNRVDFLVNVLNYPENEAKTIVKNFYKMVLQPNWQRHWIQNPLMCEFESHWDYN